VGCGHDGHPSRWPLATSGRVSGKRGKLRSSFSHRDWRVSER
jgi:hypothetical protein